MCLILSYNSLMKNDIVFAVIIFFVLALLIGFHQSAAGQHALPLARAFLSSSAPSEAGIVYRFQLVLGLALSEGQSIRITFPGEYAGRLPEADSVICPGDTLPAVDGLTVSCVGELPAGETEIIVEDITNPAKIAAEGIADVYIVDIRTGAGERGYLTVLIVEPLLVRTAIEPFLNFEVEGVGIGEDIHLDLTTGSSTANSIFLGDIPINTPILVAQDLSVKTNAAYGFRVNVFQEKEPQAEVNERTHKIHCFINGDCLDYNQALAWRSPAGILGEPETYGHFGFTSEDNSLGLNCADNYYGFGQGGRWAGLATNAEAEVMRHCSPADGQTQHQGKTRVGFQVEITILQPAGEYETTFTYVVTPIF